MWGMFSLFQNAWLNSYGYIPNDMLKWLKNSRFYGNIDRIFDISLSNLQHRKKT